jgi:polysaccharide export outer membrane protein/exopolysaccharide production protein ExoF
LEDERRIFETRLAAFEYRTGRLAQTKEMLQTQLAALEKYVSEQDTFVEAQQENLNHFDDLAKRQLTTTLRRAEAARNVMMAEGDGVRMQANLVSTRQEFNRIEMEEQALRDDRTNQAVLDLRATQARLDELQRRVETAESLLQQADTATLQLSSLKEDGSKPQPVYTIIRKVAGGFKEVSATETTVLRPGDTLKVEFPSSAASRAAPSAASAEPDEKTSKPGRKLTLEMNR